MMEAGIKIDPQKNGLVHAPDVLGFNDAYN